MLLINLSKQADKFFSTLDPKQFKQVVKEIFSLAKNPKHTDIKKMISQSKYTYYRKDIGEYRLIFRIENSSILYITVAGKRNDSDVYKTFHRK
jgi:mRNA interferase RelE/StbE